MPKKQSHTQSGCGHNLFEAFRSNGQVPESRHDLMAAEQLLWFSVLFDNPRFYG